MIEPIKHNEEVSQFDRTWFDLEYSECLVDLTKKEPRPETIISIGTHNYKDKNYPTPVMTAGEFSVISAPSKSKKSFFKSQLCASYIGGNSHRFFKEIKGHRNKDYGIIDCDTEQSKFYAQRTFKRVEKIVGGAYKNYYPFKMRHLTPEQRVAFIDYLLKSKKVKDVKLVFIDGIADLVEDTNDLVMSNYIAGKLLNWTDRHNIHVCIIIHNAYGTTKPTGHLGSAVVKKAETVFQLMPDENKEVIEVKNQYSRGREFEPFYFKINDDDALIYECDERGDFLDDDSGFSNYKLKAVSPTDAFGLNNEENNNGIPF